MRRAWLAHNTGHALDASAHTAFADDDVRTNIENLVGAVEVPLGIAGPLRVNGTYANGSFYVPLATTEGTLVSTYQYGMRAISEAGGANAYVLGDALDIAPCFVVADALAAIALADWLGAHLADLQAVAAESTTHGRLVDVRAHVFGRRVFAKCAFVPSAPAWMPPSRPVAPKSTSSRGETPRWDRTTSPGIVRSIATSLPYGPRRLTAAGFLSLE